MKPVVQLIPATWEEQRTCEANLTESIFIPKCLPTKSCKSGLVKTLFISAALFYAVILFLFRSIKNKVTWLVKKVKAKCTNQKPGKEDAKTDNDGLKYMQILFYYVQDSKLFYYIFARYECRNYKCCGKILRVLT